MKNNEIIELNIKNLINGADKYMIPLYQRNYSWGKDEIEQLIDDIYNASDNLNKNYYIGSLIVHKSKGCYEVVDGQQRLTTINILNAVIYNFFNNGFIDFELICNIEFHHRPDSKKALEIIFNNEYGNKNNNIELGYYFAYMRLLKLRDDDYSKFNSFLSFFLNNVIILRIEVLPETDLKHYFEIMNNRGEQLEQHEVLKAHFMRKFTEGMDNKDNDSIKAQALFGNIWDACSDMERNVVIGFSPEFREKLFFNSLIKDSDNKEKKLENFNYQDFDEILRKLEGQNIQEIKKGKSIHEILIKNVIKPEDGNESKSDVSHDNTSSIINFSNFLMHVLKAYKKDKQSEIELDDKKLIFTFKEYIKSLEEVKEFVFLLLKMRLIFDKYIIKYTNDLSENWSLKTPYLYEGRDTRSIQYINTFSKENQNQIVLLLSMFQTIYTAKNYKNWLFSILDGFINKNWNTNNYISNLESLAKNLAKKIAKDSDELDKGTKVRHFIFNYLDYLLYKKYKDENKKYKDESKSISSYFPVEGNRATDFNELRSYFEKFRFTYRNSVEHCYAQNLAKNNEEIKKVIDNFGNLCLIEADLNSSLSDNSPFGKRAKLVELLRKNQDRSASLKQVIMLMYDDNCWSSQSAKKTIEEHGKRMKELLNESFNS